MADTSYLKEPIGTRFFDKQRKDDFAKVILTDTIGEDIRSFLNGKKLWCLGMSSDGEWIHWKQGTAVRQNAKSDLRQKYSDNFNTSMAQLYRNDTFLSPRENRNLYPVWLGHLFGLCTSHVRQIPLPAVQWLWRPLMLKTARSAIENMRQDTWLHSVCQAAIPFEHDEGSRRLWGI